MAHLANRESERTPIAAAGPRPKRANPAGLRATYTLILVRRLYA